MSTDSQQPIQHTGALRICTSTDRDRLLAIASRSTPFLNYEDQRFVYEDQRFVSFFHGDGGRHVLPLRSQLFRDWVLHNSALSSNHAPKPVDVHAAFQVVEAFAQCRARISCLRAHRLARLHPHRRPAGPCRPTGP